MKAPDDCDKIKDLGPSLSRGKGIGWQQISVLENYCSPHQLLNKFTEQGEGMSIWARVAVTIVMMVLISFLAGVLWSNVFASQIPSYISGLIGGVVAIPVWEILARFKAKPEKKK